MADGGEIKGQAERPAGLSCIISGQRPCSLRKEKKEGNPSHITVGRARGGRWEDGWKDGQLCPYPSLSGVYSEVGLRAADHRAHHAKPPAQKKLSVSVPVLLLPYPRPPPPTSPERMWIQVFGEKPGPGPSVKTTALVSAVWAEARVETSQLLRVQEGSQGFRSLQRLSPCRGQSGCIVGPKSP